MSNPLIELLLKNTFGDASTVQSKPVSSVIASILSSLSGIQLELASRQVTPEGGSPVMHIHPNQNSFIIEIPEAFHAFIAEIEQVCSKAAAVTPLLEQLQDAQESTMEEPVHVLESAQSSQQTLVDEAIPPPTPSEPPTSNLGVRELLESVMRATQDALSKYDQVQPAAIMNGRLANMTT